MLTLHLMQRIFLSLVGNLLGLVGIQICSFWVGDSAYLVVYIQRKMLRYSLRCSLESCFKQCFMNLFKLNFLCNYVVFDELLLKIIFLKLKKYYFDMFINKNILKNNCYYIFKHLKNYPYQNGISNYNKI
jgi:hypothetical protein